MAVMMKLFAFCGFVLSGISGASSIEVTPVQKVVQLLSGMLAKGKAAKHEEEVEFAKFKVWCDDVRQEKTKAIKAGAAMMTQLNADIDKAKSDAENLAQEVSELQGAIAVATKEGNNATAVRKQEHADFLVQHKDFSESIDACAKAIQVLKLRTADVPQVLLQVKNSLPEDAKATIDSMLALETGSAVDASAPEANAYEFQSSSVISMLEKLHAKFKEQLLQLEKEEMNAKANYEVLTQQLTDNIQADGKAEKQKTAMKADRLGDAASATGELKLTEKAKAEDEDVLSDTQAQCHAQSKEFEQNQVTRAEEVASIEKAMQILTSAAVKGNAETYLPSASLLQGRKVALAQLRSSVNDDSDSRSRAAAYLQSHAKRLGSRYLAVVAEHISEDPFAKVKKMIKDLIVKLMEKANQEADQNAYCTSELATNKQTRENKGAEVEELTAKSDELKATISQLATEITDLADSISEIKAQQAEATKMRVEEKTTNANTVADAKEAQTAVEQAIKVLRDFYGSAAEPALLQAKKASTGSKAPYKGLQSESGVLGMLEVILSDFARLETQTASAEDIALTTYDKFMAESAQDVELKETEMKHKEGKKQQSEESFRNTDKNLKLTQQEVDEALNYYDKLKADCLDTGLSYDVRVKSREEEIQSLQEALKILNGEDLA